MLIVVIPDFRRETFSFRVLKISRAHGISEIIVAANEALQ